MTLNDIATGSIVIATAVSTMLGALFQATDTSLIFEYAKSGSALGFLIIVVYKLWIYFSQKVDEQDETINNQQEKHIADLKESFNRELASKEKEIQRLSDLVKK